MSRVITETSARMPGAGQDLGGGDSKYGPPSKIGASASTTYNRAFVAILTGLFGRPLVEVTKPGKKPSEGKTPSEKL